MRTPPDIRFRSDYPTTSGASSHQQFRFPVRLERLCFQLNSTGTALVYSTYLGGSGEDGSTIDQLRPVKVAVDTAGNAYVAGFAESTDFPVTSGVVQTSNNSAGGTNLTLSKLNPTGSTLLYSTYPRRKFLSWRLQRGPRGR